MADKAVNPDPRYSKLTIGVCPDQWGVWFPYDEKQVPWDKALAEMADAGFSIMETGPHGYFPTNPKPVSYTHLDVYKRQPETSSLPWMRSTN